MINNFRHLNFFNEKIVFIFGLIFYFLFPVKLNFLGFSLHIIPFGMLFLYQIFTLKETDAVLNVFLIFIGLFTVSCFFSDMPPISTSLNTWIFSFVCFFVCKNTFGQLGFKELSWGALLLLLMWSVTCIFQAFLGSNAYVPSLFGAPYVQSYPSGFTIYSNYAAITLVPMIFIVFSRITLIKTDKYSVLFGIVWLMGVVSLYLTLSRAAWVGYFIGMSVFFYLAYKKKGFSFNFFRLNLISLVLLFFVWMVPTKIDSYEFLGSGQAGKWQLYETLHKFSEAKPHEIVTKEEYQQNLSATYKKSDNVDYSTNTRVITAQVAVSAVFKYPFFGLGLGQYPNYYYRNYEKFLTLNMLDPRSKINPHNGYLQLLSESGVFTFLGMLTLIIYVFVKAYRTGPSISLYALLGSLIAVLFWLLFHDGFSLRLFWILMGCVVSASARAINKKDKL